MITNDGRQMSDFDVLVRWVRSNGGSVDSRLVLGTTTDGIRGLLAAEAIDAGAVLVHVPASLILGGGDNLPRVVRDELRKEEQSRWWPYLRLDESLTARIPAAWSEADLAELQGLEPRDSRRHIDWYSHTWAGGMPYERFSDVDKQALWMIVTRACDRGLVPVYDLANHNNGELNTRIEIGDDGSLRLIARWDLPQGQEIFNSYGHVSSSDIFRDYGFIEPWPRVWTYESPTRQQQKFALLTGQGPVVLFDEQSAVDLDPWRTTLTEKAAQALVALAPVPSVRLRAIAQDIEDALIALPTGTDEDDRLVVTATGERRRAILYRIAYKQSLTAAMQFLRRHADARGQRD